MDSLSQVALGAAVSVACMGRRTAVWKAALVGAVAGTLPDLDAFIDHGDAVANMTLHRTESHALFWLTLAAPLLAGATARLLREHQHFRAWWLAVWLALITHPLLDVMTVYGTQLGLPFTNHPFGVGSIFIIDPLYTVPLLLGTGVALARRSPAGLRWNTGGLVLSTLYLAWGVAVQQHVRGIAEASLAQAGLQAERLLVTPAPLTTLVWRVVAVTRDNAYHEGFYALADRLKQPAPRIGFQRHDRGMDLYPAAQAVPNVGRMAWFSHGFFRLRDEGGQLYITDLRMGQEPFYTFDFAVARRAGEGWQPHPAENAMARVPLREGLQWLGRRILGEAAVPPQR